MCLRILLALVLCVGLRVSAQPPNVPGNVRPLSLRDCVRLALSRNLDLQIGNLTRDIARFDLNGAYGVYVPSLSFEARHSYIDQPGQFDPKKINPDLPYELQTDLFGPRLQGSLPLGLDYDFRASSLRRDARTDFGTNGIGLYPGGIRETNDYAGQAGVEVRQHLLKDFWIDANRERVLVRRKDLRISEQALRLQIMQTVLGVSLGYYDLIAARESIRVQEQALELRQQFVAETRRRVEVGDLPPLDAEQAETQLQNTLTALAAAREVLATRQNVLKVLMTDDFAAWADVDVEPTEPLLAAPVEVRRTESFVRAMKNRPDLAEARIEVEKRDVLIRFRYNQMFPSLDFVGGYGGLGVQPDFDSTMSDVFHFRNPEYFYGVVVSLPLSNVSERNSYRSTKAAKEIAQLELKKAEQAVLAQVADWANRVQSRFSQVDSTRKARGFAQAALDAEQKKLQNGFSTSFFVLQLQETLTAARTAELQARADYNKALAQLAFAEGTILDRQQLELEVK